MILVLHMVHCGLANNALVAFLLLHFIFYLFKENHYIV